jgi:thymidylate synthase
MNRLDLDYQNLLIDILENGVQKGDRTGTGTISVFGRQIRHKMSDGFPLLTTKKMYFKGIVTELLWFLRGDTNIKYLVDNDCHIWDGDAYKKYHSTWDLDTWGVLESLSKESFINKIKTDSKFAEQWGELGQIYGKQWRRWKAENRPKRLDPLTPKSDFIYIDQIANLINDLKTTPDSRRLMVNAWNVGELDSMVLPPCHYGFQVYTRELSDKERIESAFKSIESTDGNSAALLWELSCQGKKESEIIEALNNSPRNIPTRAISLMWNQRSVDTFLGLPFNIASYGLLLEIIAKAVNMVPDELIGNLGDVHLYNNHIEQAKEQIGSVMSLEERIDYWFHTNKPNRDVVDHFDTLGLAQKIMYLDKANVPTRTREPYSLPTLKHMKTDEFYKSLGEEFSIITHLDNSDFEIENYQSHTAIKAPLSN